MVVPRFGLPFPLGCRDYVEGMHETLDLVPIGAWYGNGRKVG